MTLGKVVAALITSGAVLIPIASANEHIVDVVWNGDDRFDYAGTVAPGKFIEVCDKLRSGQVIKWQFDSAEATDFNIHFHKGKETIFPAKQSQTRQAADTLAVAVEETYCWMWRNKGDRPAALRVQLHKKQPD